jgi:DNA-directed RNA polymerase subunit omega
LLLRARHISDIINHLPEAIVQTLNGIDSKFRLAILVARRAKQLIGGARKKIESKSENPLTVAMEEFRQGKIDFDVLNEEETLFTAEAEILEGATEASEAEAEDEEVEDEADFNAEEVEEEAEPESES